MPTTTSRDDRGRRVRTITSQVVIDAPRDRVWAALRDFSAYPDWNPFTVEVRTSLQVGAPVDMQVRLRPPRVMNQVEYVTRVVDGERMCWGADIGPPRFLRADRRQVLTDLGDGRTRYESSDAFTGFGVGLTLALTGRYIQRGFDDVAAALKRRCEAGSPHDTDA